MNNLQISISVIIPLYNKEHTIAATLDSIIAQEYDDYEIVIVDDGSTDNSTDVATSYLSEKVSVVRKKNGGASSARNLGVKMAKNDYVVFLDADDYFEPGAFKVFNQLATSHPECNFFCCNCNEEWKGFKNVFSKAIKDGYLWDNFYAWSRGYLMPRAGTSMFRRSFILHYPQNERLKRYEDAESIFNMMRDTKIYMCSTPVMTYCRDKSKASNHCNNIQDDFIGHLDLKGKSMWEQYALSELYKEGLFFYPHQIDALYRKQDIRTVKVIIARKIMKLLKFWQNFRSKSK